VGIIGYFVVLAIAEEFTGHVFARFFLTTVTTSPSEEFSSVTMDDSGTKFLAGAVTAVAQRLPPVVNTTSLYYFAVALFAEADEATSRPTADTGEGA
jgi:hypothetical protein